MSVEPSEFVFDVIVIGGGIVGAGVVRDAALRGLSCLLLEKGDFGSGTSSKSSGILHGGLSYLEQRDINLVLENMHERDLLSRMAPHLLRPLPILVPIYRNSPQKPWKLRLGFRLFDLLTLGKGYGRYDMLSAPEALRRCPTLLPSGLLGAVLFHDHQLALPHRLVLENILSAREHGAFCLNYHEVTRLEEEPGFLRVHVRDLLHGTTHVSTARSVVNAAGPWTDTVSESFRPGLAPKTSPVRGTHVMVRAKVSSAVCAPMGRDGRLFFAIPAAEGRALVGLARSEAAGEADDVFPRQSETEELLAAFRQVLPSGFPLPEDVLWAFSGLHPFAAKPHPDNRSGITCRHVLHREGSEGRFLTIIGGNFTTFRKMAEETVDAACHLLHHPVPSSTDRVPFFGGGFKDTIVFRETLCEWSKGIPEFPREVLDQLVTLYGRRCCDVIHLSLERDEWRQPVSPGYADRKAQVIYAVRSEDAHHLSDVILRRLRMGLSSDRGLAGAAAVAELMAGELGWDASTTQDELARFRSLLARENPPFRQE